MSARHTSIEPLTKRQREVLDLLVHGRTNFEIAQALGVSLDGAKWHVREVLARLGVDSREQAAEVWRRERSWWGRGSAPFLALSKLLSTRIVFVAVGGVALVGAVGVAAYVASGGDEPDSSLITDATPTPLPNQAQFPEFSPRTDIPIVDEVIKVLKAGDLDAFKRLIVALPETCTAGARTSWSPVPCPPGVADGSRVEVFRAAGESDRFLPGEQTDALLARTVPFTTTLHGVAPGQPDRVNGLFAAAKYEVVAYGHTSAGQTWVTYFVDDAGVVGMYGPNGFGVTDRFKDIDRDDWLIAPYSVPRFAAEKDLYVIGRDSQITFVADLPKACAGKPIAIRLYGHPDPGVAGGIQSMTEPGLMSEARTVGSSQGETITHINLPSSISGPMLVRPGLLAPCLSDIAVQGAVQLALLAPPEDAQVAVIEYSGKALDLSRGQGSGTVGEFLAPLAATVNGTVCQTIDTADRSLRNARGNVVFRIGASDQPPPCRAPGVPIVFLFPPGLPESLAGKPLVEKPLYVPGAIQIVRNIGPEGIAN